MSTHPMRLKPVRFVGHKLGPFDHIELDWEKDSRYTLIVAENGMGKTTLITAIAACLAGGNGKFFPNHLFYTLGQDNTSYAYLEFDIEGERSAIFRSASQQPAIEADFDLHALSKDATQSPFLKRAWGGDITKQTSNLDELNSSWTWIENIHVLAAAYGVHRNIWHHPIGEYREPESGPMDDILNPFTPPSSEDILQWISNRHIDRALALAEYREDEANSYLVAIQRVEYLLIRYPTPQRGIR